MLLLLTSALNAQVDKGLVAKYSFNKGNANNEIGNNNAKVYGAPLTEDRFGNARSAYFLQGNYDSYINLGTSNVLKPKKGTISLWVKIDGAIYKGSGVDHNPIIYTKSHAGDDFNEAFLIAYNFNVRKININTSFSELKQVNLIATNTTYLRQWYHVVISYDNNFLCFYLDGTLVGKAAKNFESRFLEGDSVIIGSRSGEKNNRYLMGSIDDISIYNRVLSPAEVNELYHAPDPNRYNQYLKWFYMIMAFIALTMLTVWLIVRRYKSDLEKQKVKNRVDARLNELETKAIRSQMNPHFIFNSLNSLQRFILEDDKVNAYAYLIEFSTLLRKLLESSEADSIPLKEEIDILNSYLRIESLRFANSFQYEVVCYIENMEQVNIPFMLVQPFAENAIWHGLLHKSNDRRLSISFTNVDDRRLRCTVDDNGVGRNGLADRGTIKKKSLAIDFIRQRLDLLEKTTGITCSFKIIDKKDDLQNSLGTTVEIIIPKIS